MAILAYLFLFSSLLSKERGGELGGWGGKQDLGGGKRGEILFRIYCMKTFQKLKPFFKKCIKDKEKNFIGSWERETQLQGSRESRNR